MNIYWISLVLCDTFLFSPMICNVIKIGTFLCLANVCCLPLRAQNEIWGSNQISKHTQNSKDKVKKWKAHMQQAGLDTNYNHEFDAGLKLNTNGWSGCMDMQKKIRRKQTTIWTLSFSEIKDDKQTKQQATTNAFPQLGNTSPFVFGKINNLYTLQLGYGRQVLLLPAVLDGNISVSFRYSGGLSLAMLKPYCLKLIYLDQSQSGIPATVQQEKYTASNSDRFLNTGYILGAANWTNGLNDMQYVPGGFLEGAVVVEPGKNKSFVQVVTIGGNAAIYAQSLPIMADRPAHAWQASFFIGLSVGKRWRRV